MSDHEESKIKVTDKRMFAPDGSLREEYRFLEEEAKKPPARPAAESPPPEPEKEPKKEEAPVRETRQTRKPAEEPAPDRAERPDPGPPPGPELPGTGRNPGIYDLVMALAEPASVYLRNAVQSPAEASQSLEVARLYIDLLDVLRQKTAGNLTAQESDMLEDALHQLRLGYVQTKG